MIFNHNILDGCLVLSGWLIFALVEHGGFTVCADSNELLRSSEEAPASTTVLGNRAVRFILS